MASAKVVSECITFANNKMRDCFTNNDKKPVKDIRQLKQEAEEVMAWSSMINKLSDMWLNEQILENPPTPDSQDYFDFIKVCKYIDLTNTSSQPTKALEALKNDDSLDYVNIGFTPTFNMNNFGVLQVSDSGSPFIEYIIPRECDVITQLKCTNNFEVIIGGISYGKADNDAILLIAAQYHEVKVRIFVENTDLSVQLQYYGSIFATKPRIQLANSRWVTKNAEYHTGLVMPRVFH
jgi:hypothetical protein